MHKLITSTVLLCCMAQVNASMMQYNTSNQMIRVDKQSLSYNSKGYLASVDNIHIINMKHGAIIEQQGSMVATTFGGVRLISNGATQTIFTDNHSTLKTTSSDKNQRSYTDPYGNPIQKDAKESYPLEHNRLTFDGGYKITKDITNFNARNYILPFKVFSSMDSSNVANRYNFSDGNPIMKFDPSGHNAQDTFNSVGAIVGIIFGMFSGGIGFSLLSTAGYMAGGVSVISLFSGLSSLITNSIAADYEAYNNDPSTTDKISQDTIDHLKIASTGLAIASLVFDIASFTISGIGTMGEEEANSIKKIDNTGKNQSLFGSDNNPTEQKESIDFKKMLKEIEGNEIDNHEKRMTNKIKKWDNSKRIEHRKDFKDFEGRSPRQKKQDIIDKRKDEIPKFIKTNSMTELDNSQLNKSFNQKNINKRFALNITFSKKELPVIEPPKTGITFVKSRSGGNIGNKGTSRYSPKHFSSKNLDVSN